MIGSEIGSLGAGVRLLCDRLHDPGRATALLASFPAGPRPPGQAVSGLLAFRPPEATLPTLTPTLRRLRYPLPSPGTPTPRPDDPRAPRCTVHRLALDGDGVVWSSVLREEGMGTSSSPLQSAQELWRFDPADDSFRTLPVEGLEGRKTVAAIIPQADRLWLALDLTGIMRYNPRQEQVERLYTPGDGLTTASMDAGVADDHGRLYFTGHANGQVLLNVFDPARQTWRRLPVPEVAAKTPVANASGHLSGTPTAQAAVCGRWLLVGSGEHWTLFDTETRQPRDLRAVLPTPLGEELAAVPNRPAGGVYTPATLLSRAPSLCAADAHGFWLAASGRIFRFDPSHPEQARSWPLPSDLYFGVTALAPDGGDLWVLGPSNHEHPRGLDALLHPGTADGLAPRFGFGPSFDGRGFLAVLDATDGHWRGGFEVPQRAGCLAVSPQSVYVGLLDAAQPILEIDKASTLGSAPSR